MKLYRFDVCVLGATKGSNEHQYGSVVAENFLEAYQKALGFFESQGNPFEVCSLRTDINSVFIL